MGVGSRDVLALISTRNTTQAQGRVEGSYPRPRKDWSHASARAGTVAVFECGDERGTASHIWGKLPSRPHRPGQPYQIRRPRHESHLAHPIWDACRSYKCANPSRRAHLPQLQALFPRALAGSLLPQQTEQRLR